MPLQPTSLHRFSPPPLTRALALLLCGFSAALAANTQSTATALTLEEQRVEAACAELQLNCSADFVPALISSQFDQANGVFDSKTATRLGNLLWRRSQQLDDQRQLLAVDDRKLYWSRLAIKSVIKNRHQSTNADAKRTLELALTRFERASRGFDDLTFGSDADLQILITGFDPFGLHNQLDQSNPSGVAALSFDGLVISSAGISAELQSAVFPVRFADFDEGMVESVVTPLLAERAVDAIVTISMGRDDFDLERFPGRRRSATAPDNLMILTGANAEQPLVPMLNGADLSGPEFVEFSLPVDSMQAIQSPFKVNDNRSVTTVEQGTGNATSLGDIVNNTSVRGSGGGYLSNEISYRTVRLAQQDTRDIAAGHIHTPRIAGANRTTSHNITRQIRAMLEAALPELANRRKARHTEPDGSNP